MKKILTLTTALAALALPALAGTPVPTNQPFADYLAASGCVLIDKGGYQNIASVNGGGCAPEIIAAYSGGFGTRATPGEDGVLGTADDGEVTDR